MKQLAPADFRARYGPWAVVAGASAGLGAEFATQLASKGLHLVLVARRQALAEDLGKKLTQEYGIDVRVLQLDLAAEDSAATIASTTSDIEVGLLIYNAATSIIGPFFASPLEEHTREVMVNCHTPLALTYLLGQRMLPRKHGGIVLMSSLSSSQGSVFIANYAATKAYNRVLAEGLWEELREQGIDVLTSCPSAISTPNYLASSPTRSGRFTVSAQEPRVVVAETLAALGHGPTLIPGSGNRLANFFMQRVLPHRAAIKLMGRVMRSMYAHP
jgi:short-subunit dehydrogenase